MNAAVLNVKIVTDGVRAATAQITALNASYSSAARSARDFAKQSDTAAKHVKGLSKEIDGARQSTDLWQDAAGRWRRANGQFATDADKAAAGIKNVTRAANGGRGGLGSLNKTLDGLGGGFSALAAAAITAAPAVVALSGSLVALVAALGPLVGLGPAAAVGLSALAQAASVGALASMGVGDALKEQISNTGKMAKAATSSADQQRAAAKAIATAQEGVRDATRALASAEADRASALKALGPAQAQAKRDLQDMHSSLTAAALNEQGAVIRLKDARDALAHAQAPQDAQKLADAQDRLTDSTYGQQKAVQGLAAARQRLDDLMKPPDALTLADAQDAVADSTRDQERATLALANAQADLAKVMGDPKATDQDRAEAKLAVADAENAIGDASRSSQKAQQQLAKLQGGPDQEQVAKAKQDIADAEQSVADAAKQTAKAEREVQEAQKGADPDAVAKATLEVAQAELALADATRTRARLQKDVAKADKDGVKGAEGVVAARDAITAANDRVSESERNLAKAHVAVKDAQASAAAGMASATQAAVDLNQKFDDLPPAAQSFVRALQALKPRFDELRQTAAAGLFPGVTAGIMSATQNFGPLNKVVGETAATIGGLAKRAGDLVGSKGFGKDVETIGHRNSIIIERVGKAAIYAGDMLRHIIVAAGPLTTWLAKVTEQWAKSADGAVEAGRKSGALADFFQSTRNTLIKVGSILGNLAEAFFNVGKAAAPAGRDILDAIDKVTGKFAEWTKSLEGRNALAKFFETANTVMASIVPVVVSVAKSFGELTFFILPAFLAVMEKLGPLAGPVIQALIALKAAATAASAIGALAAFANPIGLVVLAVVALGAAFVIAYKKSEAFREFVTKAWEGVKEAVVTAATTVRKWLNLGSEDADNAKESLSNLGKAALWVFDNVLKPAADRVFPILREYLHGFVQQLGGFIKIVTGILSGDWARAWEGVKQVVEGQLRIIWALLGGALGILFDTGKALVGALVDGIKAVPGLLLEGAKFQVTTIVDGIKALPGLIADAAKWMVDAFKKAVEANAALWLNIGKWVVGTVTDGIKALPGKVTGAAVWLRDTLKDGVESLSGSFTNRGKDVIGWISDGVQTPVGKLTGFAVWLRDTLKGALESLIPGFTNRGGQVLDWIADGLRPDELPGKLLRFPMWFNEQLAKLLGGVQKGFTDLGGNIMGWIVDGLKEGAFELQGFLNKIIDLVNKLPGVDIKHLSVLSKDKSGKVQGFAHGGAYARTGGMVSQPMTLMGEEAPRHPEFVIPTNPAYRRRAQQLAMQAAGAVGLAQGGTFKSSSYGPPWTGINGSGVTATGVDLRPSKQFYGVAVDPSVIQLGSMLKINPNPFGTDEKFKAFDTGSAIKGNRIDFYDWRGRDAQYGWGMRDVSVSGSGGVLGKVGDVIGDVVDALNPMDLIGKLPGAGSLPEWLQGLGKSVLDGIGGWIKGKVLGGDGTSGGLLDGKLQLPASFSSTHQTAGLPGYPAIDVFGKPGTRVLSPADAVVSRLSGSLSNYTGPGGPFGYSMYLDSAKGQYFLTHLGSRSVQVGDHVKYGQMIGTVADYPFADSDHIHEGFHAFAKGGMFGGLPFIGTYHTGGVAPREGLAHVARGEVMTPAGSGGARIYLTENGDVHINEEHDVERLARTVGFQLAR